MLQNDEMITLGADTEEGELMGICIATIRETKHPIMVPKKTVYIEDIYVSQQYRKQGVGISLYQSVERLAQDIGQNASIFVSGTLMRRRFAFMRKQG